MRAARWPVSSVVFSEKLTIESGRLVADCLADPHTRDGADSRPMGDPCGCTPIRSAVNRRRSFMAMVGYDPRMVPPIAAAFVAAGGLYVLLTRRCVTRRHKYRRWRWSGPHSP
jgi:hypothetical protein